MFTDLTKTQINPETQHVHLAVRITDNHVHNLVFSLKDFFRIMSSETLRWKGNIQGIPWELQKLSNHVKIFSASYEFHYRFNYEQWKTIRKQFTFALHKNNLA